MRVVAVVAHSDDEVLGCGGALARHALEGDQVEVVVLCETTSLRYQPGQVSMSEQLRASMEALGGLHCYELGYPDQRLDNQSFIAMLHAVGHSGNPGGADRVYTHWHHDLNRDHRIVNELVQVLTRPRNGSSIEVFEFPTASSTEYTSPLAFVPDTWIDISLTLRQKQAAMECYRSELQTDLLPRSTDAIWATAKHFGSQVGVEAAEVFHTLRRVL